MALGGDSQVWGHFEDEIDGHGFVQPQSNGRETDLLPMERGGEGNVKRRKMCDVRVRAPQEEYGQRFLR